MKNIDPVDPVGTKQKLLPDAAPCLPLCGKITIGQGCNTKENICADTGAL